MTARFSDSVMTPSRAEASKYILNAPRRSLAFCSASSFPISPFSPRFSARRTSRRTPASAFATFRGRIGSPKSAAIRRRSLNGKIESG